MQIEKIELPEPSFSIKPDALYPFSPAGKDEPHEVSLKWSFDDGHVFLNSHRLRVETDEAYNKQRRERNFIISLANSIGETGASKQFQLSISSYDDDAKDIGYDFPENGLKLNKKQADQVLHVIKDMAKREQVSFISTQVEYLKDCIHGSFKAHESAKPDSALTEHDKTFIGRIGKALHDFASSLGESFKNGWRGPWR